MMNPFSWNLTPGAPFPPQRKYTWDAENRLTAVEPTVPVEDDVQLRFTYDYLGRRVQKQVFRWDTGTSDWNTTAETDLRFVYDGWNVILVLDGLNSNAVTRQYTWGLDLSGTLHGAGGVGGLLAAVETQGTGSPGDDQNYWFLYDGNGNVGQVLDATDTGNISVAAKYEYDPYGNLIASDGTYATTNPFRFSTKWFDDGLYYYGYRYYLPRLGRWISRDPIEEQGGLNLYVYVLNNAIGAVDPKGLKGCCGQDITGCLLRVGASIETAFNTAPPAKQRAACRGMLSLSGWEIIQLGPKQANAGNVFA